MERVQDCCDHGRCLWWSEDVWVGRWSVTVWEDVRESWGKYTIDCFRRDRRDRGCGRRCWSESLSWGYRRGIRRSSRCWRRDSSYRGVREDLRNACGRDPWRRALYLCATLGEVGKWSLQCQRARFETARNTNVEFCRVKIGSDTRGSVSQDFLIWDCGDVLYFFYRDTRESYWNNYHATERNKRRSN